ncbi:MAG: purine-binding chemotaxis protein CheW [Deltaproteobacteria bacterium]|nr:purine-binding chemotaxis protein CheW [Deltaproteobacteria bacterium]
MFKNKLFCTFYLDKHYFGVEASKVQEIIRYQVMSRVPLANGVVQGLINIRGQIVTALDLAKRLGLESKKKEKKAMNVVIKTDEGAVSLMVDEIGDVIEMEEENFENCPETLYGPIRELIVGTYKLKEKLLLVLDTNKVVQVE